MFKRYINNIRQFIKKNKLCIISFISIFILIYHFHNVIYMYYDDYGNASLSYGYNVSGVLGTNYSFKDLIKWSIEIYNHWGGRIIYAIFFLIPLLKNGITNYMHVQSFVIIGIIYYIYKIIIFYNNNYNKKNNFIIPILIYVFLNLTDITILRHGIYWASASILYIWPLLSFFMFIYYYIKLSSNIENINKYRIVFLILLTFLIVLSQEQFGIGLIMFIISFIFLHHRKKLKQHLLVDLPLLLFSIINYCFMIFAPGNFERLNTKNIEFAKLSLIDKIYLNYKNMISMLFFDKFNIFMFLLCIIFIYIIYKVFKNDKKRLIFYNFFNILVLLQMFLYNPNYYHQRIFLIIATIWFILLFIISIKYFKLNNKDFYSSILVGGFSTIICLLVSPVIGGRTFLPFIFFVFLLLTLVFYDCINENNIIKYLSLLIIIPIGFISIKNYYIYYNGYKDNYYIHKENEKKLRNYANKKQIKLRKVKNELYGSTMPYEELSMEYYIKEYYNIPNDVKFIWR